MPALLGTSRVGLLRPVVGGGVAPVVGSAIGFVARDATAIDPSTTSDAGLGIGADGNGWTALITLKGISQDANVNATDGSKVTIAVTDPGFTTTGATTTVSRTITGSIAIRRQYPNNTQRMISASGSDLQIMLGLDQPIYAATTIVSVTVAAGFYPGSVATTLPGSAITNTSTRAYPKPLFGWLNRQRERATGTGFAIEALAYHRHARNGQQVACVEFFGKDAAGHVTASQVASAPALSSFQTAGNIVEAWKATIPLSALGQTTGTTSVANMPFVDAKVYPWIGDSSAITQLSVDGYVTAGGDPRPMQLLYFVNDKNATYGGAFAYVKAGASGGTVSTTAATARAAPYPTLVAAMAAIKTYNNTNFSHNDFGGSIIRLMDDGAGGAVTHDVASSPANSPGITYCTIEPDPSNTAAVSLQPNAASNITVPMMLAFGALTLLKQAGAAAQNFLVSPSAYSYVSFDGTTINLTGSSQPLLYNIAGSTRVFSQVRNSTTNNGLLGGSGGYAFTPLLLGHTGSLGTVGIQMIVGCNFSGTNFVEGPNTSSGVAQPGCDSGIVVNNRFMSISAAASQLGYTFPYTKGVAFVQNVVEILGNNSNAIFNIAADGATQPVDNIIEMHNTVVGNRGNRMYCDVTGSIGQRKRGIKRYCLDYSWPIKSDLFRSNQGNNATYDVTGRVSNWEYCYDVDNFGNCTLAGAATEAGTTLFSNPDPSGSGWQGMWAQPTSNKKLVTEVGRTGTPVYAAQVAFSSDRSYFGTNAGGGDYHLIGTTNAAFDRVIAGQAALKYDLAGTARRNDGSGAAGAYERP